MSIVQAERETCVHPIVTAYVAESGKARLTVRWPSGVAKSRWLKRAATRVPGIVAVRQPHRVNVRADRKPVRGSHYELAKCIGAVHHVVERKPRVDAGRGEHLEECAVALIRRVVVAGGVVIASPKPRLEPIEPRGLPPGFNRKR